MTKKVLVVIPALNPPIELKHYVQELSHQTSIEVLLVDDGSSAQFQPLFDELEQYSTVLHHEKNKGKGRALKTAFEYFLQLNQTGEYAGVVTADSDGQHTLKDVLAVAELLEPYPDSLLLGCRDFDLPTVPFKSKFGNKLTKTIIRLLYGKKVSDTQTGLRGFPTNIIPNMLEVKGERFEYETEMLVYAFNHGILLHEVTIETVYYDNNAETHFNPIKDSIRIYRVILASFFKYLLSSVSSFVIDIVMFKILLLSIGSGVYGIMFSNVGARMVSSLFNFFVNKKIVFDSKASITKAIIKYYVLCAVQLSLSTLLVSGIWSMTHVEATVIKVLVDLILFVISYHVQRKWVFQHENT